MSLTNDAETDVLSLYFNNDDHGDVGDTPGLQGSATAGSYYISLHTADPTDTGSVTNEISGGAYARATVARSAGGWTISGSNASNTAAITFIQATANWGTITHFGIHTASSGSGNMLAHGALTSSVVINDTDQFEFAIGDLDVNID